MSKRNNGRPLIHSRMLKELSLGAKASTSRIKGTWQDALKSDAFLGDAHVTVDLHFGDGTVRRMSTKAIETVSGTTGKKYSYEPELAEEPEIYWAAEPGKTDAEARSMNISIRRESVDIAAAMASGAHVAGFGEICIQMDGTDYDNRIIVMSGLMSGGMSFGRLGESVSITLMDPKEVISSPMPSERITLDRFPNAPEDSIGHVFPRVYNYWGSIPAVRINDGLETVSRTSHTAVSSMTDSSTSVFISGSLTTGGVHQSEGLIRVNDEIMRYFETDITGTQGYKQIERAQEGTVAESHGAGALVHNVEITAASEWVVCSNTDFEVSDENAGYRDGSKDIIGSKNNLRTLELASDELGTHYTKLTFTTPATYGDMFNNGKDGVQFTDDDELKVVDWTGATKVFVQGTTSRDYDLMDIVQDVFDTYGQSGSAFVNTEMLSETAGLLPHFEPNVIINGSGEGDSATTIEWIEKTLLRDFPMVSTMFRDGKYGPVLMDARGPVSGEFEVGTYPCMDRDTTVQESASEDCFNEFSMNYYYNAISDEYQKFAEVDESNNSFCAISSQSLGTMSMPIIESPYIGNQREARYVLEWYAAHYARPHYTADYCFSPWAMINLRVGDVIRITDAEVGFSSSRALITSIRYVRGKCTLTLDVYPKILGMVD